MSLDSFKMNKVILMLELMFGQWGWNWDKIAYLYIYIYIFSNFIVVGGIWELKIILVKGRGLIIELTLNFNPF